MIPPHIQELVGDLLAILAIVVGFGIIFLWPLSRLFMKLLYKIWPDK